MPHPVVLSADAISDVDKAFEYYNSRSYGLGLSLPTPLIPTLKNQQSSYRIHDPLR